MNQTTGDIVHSLAITELTVSGNTAAFSGLCRIENAAAGTLCWFWATVVNNGEGSQAAQDNYTVVGGSPAHPA